MRTLVWYRGKDVRIQDHEALREAVQLGQVIPLFVVDPYFFEAERARQLPHRMQYLLASLTELERALQKRGSELVLAPGKSVKVVPELAERWRVDRVAVYRWSEPFGRERDERVRAQLEKRGIELISYEGETLAAPESLRTGAGKPFRVFTPFAKAFRERIHIKKPVAGPADIPPLPKGVQSTTVLPKLDSLGLQHNPKLLPGGESQARRRLRACLSASPESYTDQRERLDLQTTSRLSQDLKFGTLSVRTVWHTATDKWARSASDKFLSELIWRDFAYATLYDSPHVLDMPFRHEFQGFPWRDADEDWQAWVAGQTGYPIVDAAARQLLTEGFVHNRARMVAASFLSKHLLLDYRAGEAHYLKYLTDGDWAQNNFNWQWVAGVGLDAQPYFRIFNPVTQGKKFDPTGAYVRQWLPELAKLDTRHLHAPWVASSTTLERAGVRLGDTYPRPIVDHQQARERYLRTVKRHLGRRRCATIPS